MARPIGYDYSALRQETSEELLVFHWHPERESHVQAPHLHLGPSLLQVLGTKRSAHLPTGSIRVADFVELLQRDFNAKPQRQDWRLLLEDSEV